MREGTPARKQWYWLSDVLGACKVCGGRLGACLSLEIRAPSSNVPFAVAC